jgi:hypothetical protein
MTYTLSVWRFYEIPADNDEDAIRIAKAVSAALSAGAVTSGWNPVELSTDVRRGHHGKVLWEENRTEEATG